MPLHDEFSTILAVVQNQNDLILRLDVTDWLELEDYKDVIIEHTLIECKDARKSFDEIKRFVGELVWSYEFAEDERKFKILLDDGSELEIECREVTDKRDDLTIDELLQKFQVLSRSFQSESSDGRKGWSKYGRLNRVLKRELEKEVRNWESKEKFFAQTGSESRETAKIMIRLCKRILNFAKQIEEENA